MKKIEHEILRIDGASYNIPVFLESTVKEMGIMVGFDGDMEQVEQFCNFTYTGDGYDVTVYNTLNTNKLKVMIDSIFTISWGDGTTDSIIGMPTVYDTILPYGTHSYSTGGVYTIKITINSPWKVESTEKIINIPFINSYGYPTDLGTLTFEIPYSDPPIYETQTYLEDYTTQTGQTNDTIISFIAIGKSRIDEVRNYGTVDSYSGITMGSTDVGKYTGYTIDGLFYMDYEDGYTHITGLTSSFQHEETYNGMITRNEHLIGFVEEPTIYSDIFVERGKQGVLERNLRLGEIDSTGEIEIYGMGFFSVKKQ